MEERYKDIKYNDLTDEQIDSLSVPEMINKSLSEYVFDINDHIDEMISCKKNSIGIVILMLLSINILGWYTLLGILPLAYFVIGYFVMKNSLKWIVKSFKTTIALFRMTGKTDDYDYLIVKHINYITRTDIGEQYT